MAGQQQEETEFPQAGATLAPYKNVNCLVDAHI